jgi:hypothetical protein
MQWLSVCGSIDLGWPASKTNALARLLPPITQQPAVEKPNGAASGYRPV